MYQSLLIDSTAYSLLMDHRFVMTKGFVPLSELRAILCRATEDGTGHSEEFWQNMAH